ncbi:MAG: 1-acyl-sn-glycerol-3-phosphate acyltransferase [Flavobacteriia bacterium]|nr:1-acyl-sn-glycerol-3-phosphate acyltransferase [Flavobacteriia bacterium]
MNIFSKIYSFFVNKRLLFYSLLGILLFVFGYFGFQLKINNDIYSVFPQKKEYKKINTWLKNSKFNKQVIFSIEYKKNQDPDSLLQEVTKTIQNSTKSYLNNFQLYTGENNSFFISFWQKNNPIFWNENQYQKLEQHLHPDSIKIALEKSKTQLNGVQAVFLQKFISSDPLSWYWTYIQSFQTTNKNSNYENENGILFKDKKSKILFFAELSFDSNNKEKATLLRNQLDELSAQFNKNNRLNKWDYFGTFLIANDNAKQINKDNLLTLCVSISLILALLIFYYRNLLIPFLFILGPLFGAVLGVFMLYSFKKEVSALSLSVSAILFGIVLDYSFHFFTHLKHCLSIEKTVKEIVFPMFVGSFTTVAAFAALCFTSSTFLQELGFFAVFCLLGTAFFNVVFLPVILTHLRFKFSEKTSNLGLLFDRFAQKKWGKKAVLPLFILIIGSMFLANPKFDSDLNHLSYHTEALKTKELNFTGIHPSRHKKIFILTENKDFNQAAQDNFLLYQNLISRKEELKIDEVISLAPFYFSDKQILNAQNQWNSFWKNKKDLFWKDFTLQAEKQNFNVASFSSFKRQIFNPNFSCNEINSTVLKDAGLSNFIIKNKNSTSFITSVSLDKQKVNELKNVFKNKPNIHLIDRADFSSSLLKDVQTDFSTLFYFASILVFVSLLVVYGRIELAIFSFLPMIISWLLIISVMYLLKIPFNFVNILISTIIFGLGDDYSIFVTDGLLQKYKFNSPVLKSYQSAIFLSVLTTIIGTGVFFFAKHPAIHSIALISVLGLAIIYFVSVFIQPHLFEWWLGKRKKEKQAPLTFFVGLFTIILYLYFISGCLLLYPFLLIVSILPIPSINKKKIINFTISKLAKSVIYFGIHVKKSIQGKENLDLSKPGIIIANHASFLDILLMLMLSPKIIIMVKKWVYYSPLFGFLVRKAGYIYAHDGSDKNLEEVQKNFNEGYSLVIFPEGTRSKTGQLGRFHKGAFWLAEQLKCSIQPILIQGAYDVVSKKDMQIKSGELNLKILPKIEANDSRFVFDLRDRTKKITQYFKEELEQFDIEKKDVDYLYHRILRAYLFKSPIIEWYVKIKWKLEKKNYEFYNELIGDKTIVDFGCGYGYLDLFLHFVNPNRKIFAYDYDEEKIQIAKNIHDKNENLNFECMDLSQNIVPKSEVYLFLDVLHYLTEKNQIEILTKAFQNLENNGLILIREGIIDLKEKHKNTERSEILSTKIFSFNKKKHEFHFISKEFIFNLAKIHSLQVDMISHSSNTSNVLFILKK